MSDSMADVLRGSYPKVLARTMAFTRSLPDAEDAVQEAVVRALETWPSRGRPDSAEAWLLTVARNAHRDRARRTAREDLTSDPLESIHRWAPGIVRSHCVGTQARGVGAVRVCELKGDIRVTETMVAWTEGRSLSYVGDGAPGGERQAVRRAPTQVASNPEPLLTEPQRSI